MTELHRDDPSAGLGILDAIASEWGVEVGAEVTMVWFVLAGSRPGAGDQPRSTPA